MHPSGHVPSGAMGELSEDSEPNARVTAAEGSEGGSDQQDRPKLVALPGPVAPLVPAPDEAPPAADDADPAAGDAEPESGGVAPESPPASVPDSVSEPASAAVVASLDGDRLALER